jgi:hypothetical protein
MSNYEGWPPRCVRKWPVRNYTLIVATTYIEPDRPHRTTYELDGPAMRPIAISRELLNFDPGLLDRLPWRLIHIGDDCLINARLYVMPSFAGLWAWIKYRRSLHA